MVRVGSGGEVRCFPRDFLVWARGLGGRWSGGPEKFGLRLIFLPEIKVENQL